MEQVKKMQIKSQSETHWNGRSTNGKWSINDIPWKCDWDTKYEKGVAIVMSKEGKNV